MSRPFYERVWVCLWKLLLLLAKLTYGDRKEMLIIHRISIKRNYRAGGRDFRILFWPFKFFLTLACTFRCHPDVQRWRDRLLNLARSGLPLADLTEWY
ncbi:2,3,4,5-tetrahydropyridine-2,6-dicarboxylate N-acetyltransferase [Trichinella spiralis]|uniref:2,3,4,5-tetrahydropyridine-2,6-dicarboxylate N-acetyltransferase n=1 Tax=Trichinella spiralis TaxID=6334 RepID=A0ABR3KSG1_TRISP